LRFQLLGPWPVGQFCIPSGEIIDGAGEGDWNRLAQGRVPPIECVALDQEAYDLLVLHHGYWAIRTGPGVRRHADPNCPADYDPYIHYPF
jgi:hypothetical protein